MPYRHDWTPGRKCRKCLAPQPPRDKITKRRAIAPPCTMERSRRRGDGTGKPDHLDYTVRNGSPARRSRALAAPHGFITTIDTTPPRFAAEFRARGEAERHTAAASNAHAIHERTT